MLLQVKEDACVYAWIAEAESESRKERENRLASHAVGLMSVSSVMCDDFACREKVRVAGHKSRVETS